MPESKVEPSKLDVDKAVWSIASQSLDGKPAGTTVMIDGPIGLKKMGFWWVRAVHGWRAAFKQLYCDWRARHEC